MLSNVDYLKLFFLLINLDKYLKSKTTSIFN